MNVLTCTACGFDGPAMQPSEAPRRFTTTAAEIARELDTQRADRLRARSEPGRWSALEYACHVRDVFLVQRGRLVRALVEELPDCLPMHRAERALLTRYNEQDPLRVAAQTLVAAELAADAFAAVDPAGWARRLLYHWPSVHQLDVADLARHTAHEAAHHLQDMRKGGV